MASAIVAANAFALPADDSSMVTDAGAASYSFNALTEQGTLVFEQNNSMVTFGDAVDIGAGQTLRIDPGAAGDASWAGVLRDHSGMVSELNGTLDANMRVFFLNPDGVLTGAGFTVDFASLANNAGMLMLSSHNIDSSLLAQGEYSFSAPGNGAAINVQGLQLVGSGGDIAVLAEQINIDGSVSAEGARFSAVSAGAVDVVFGVNELIAIRAPLSSAGGVAVSASGSVEANRIRLAAVVDDPLGLALNNSGMLAASGVSVNERGEVILHAAGSNLLNTGSIDTRDAQNGDGNISLAANAVGVGGAVQAGQGSIAIDVGSAGGASTSAADGTLVVLDNANVTAASVILRGLGENNAIEGLANYRVSGTNSGTAGWSGVGGSGWDNTGSVSFDGFSRLLGRVDVEHLMRIDASGELVNQAGDALIRGGARSDRFEVAGTVDNLQGIGGDDSFIMLGGLVNGLIDGGGGIDSIENVFNPVRSGPGGSTSGINGSSDFVDWVNIQTVVEAIVPDPIPLPTPLPDLSSLQAPQLSFSNVNNIAAASLGVVGNAEPRLPCGFGGSAGAALQGEDMAAEEPCFDEQRIQQFQHLISSLVHFDHDSALIKPEYAKQLDAVANFFVGSNVFRRLQISGHTDDVGSETYNLALSQRRAASAARYLQGQGVRTDLIETFSFGEALPAVANNSAANRAHNRRARIELKR